MTRGILLLFGWVQSWFPRKRGGCVLCAVCACLCFLVSRRADERLCLSLHSFKSVSLCTTLLVGEAVGGNCGSNNTTSTWKSGVFFSRVEMLSVCCMLFRDVVGVSGHTSSVFVVGC
ncbi:hypothetical protein QR685DRAFT_525177 [Neurospora intermedia]|uniref:Secreted protein n=1 Tax=Neurospora intermedia TaxID=5142 RepID=A0ABR3DE72_NEUIN